MPERLQSTVKIVAFWPLASGDGVESIAVRFGPSLREPFVVRLTSRTEPRLAELSGYVGFALKREFAAEDEFEPPQSVCMWHFRRATAAAAHAGSARRQS